MWKQFNHNHFFHVSSWFMCCFFTIYLNVSFSPSLTHSNNLTDILFKKIKIKQLSSHTPLHKLILPGNQTRYMFLYIIWKPAFGKHANNCLFTINIRYFPPCNRDSYYGYSQMSMIWHLNIFCVHTKNKELDYIIRASNKTFLFCPTGGYEGSVQILI